MEIRYRVYLSTGEQMIFSVSSLTRSMHHFHEDCERYAGDESWHDVLSFFTSVKHRSRLQLRHGFHLAFNVPPTREKYVYIHEQCERALRTLTLDLRPLVEFYPVSVRRLLNISLAISLIYDR